MTEQEMREVIGNCLTQLMEPGFVNDGGPGNLVEALQDYRHNTNLLVWELTERLDRIAKLTDLAQPLSK